MHLIHFYFTAEFIIMLGEQSSDLDEFKENLAKNGAEFPVSQHCILTYKWQTTAMEIWISTLCNNFTGFICCQPSETYWEDETQKS